MTRLRRDPRDRTSIRRPARTVEPDVEEEARVLDESSGLVVALIASDAGALTEGDRQTLAFGRTLADRVRLGLLALVAGSEAPVGLAAIGVDRVATLPATEARVLVACLTTLQSMSVVRFWVGLEDTPFADALRRFAAQTAMPYRGRVARLTEAGCDCLEDSGLTQRARSLAPVMLAAQDHFRAVADGRPGAAQQIELRPFAVPPDTIHDMGVERPDAAGLALTEAHLVLGAGAGVSDWPLFHQLARALGAAEAGSRVVCDVGHLPRSRQVGASGAQIAPRCYIALGISGAVQHLQGIAECRRVVAVNSDPHAPILARADLAVTADAGQVMRRLLDLLETAG